MISMNKLFFAGLLSGTFIAFSANAQDDKAKKADAPIGKGIEGLPKDIVKKIDESTSVDLSSKLNVAINMLGREGLNSLKFKVRLEFIEKKISALEASAKGNANISKVKDLIADPGFKKKALEILDKPNFSDEIVKIFKENSLTARDVKEFVELRKLDKTKSDLKLALDLIVKEFNQENPSISGIPLPNSNEDFGKEVENIIAILSSKPTKSSAGSDSVSGDDGLKNVIKELLGVSN